MNMCQKYAVFDKLKRYGKHFLFCVCLQIWYLIEQTSKTSLLHGQNAYNQCNGNAWLNGFIQFPTATLFPPKSVRGAVFNLAVMQRQFNTPLPTSPPSPNPFRTPKRVRAIFYWSQRTSVKWLYLSEPRAGVIRSSAVVYFCNRTPTNSVSVKFHFPGTRCERV